MNEERQSLGDGWTKDSTGQVFDPDGYKWYGSTITSQAEVQTSPEASPIIQDTGSGEQKVLRFFECKHPPATEIPPGEEVLKAVRPFISQGLYKSGLMEDDNHSPVIHQTGRITTIVMVCKPSGRRLNIYEGMKHGQEVVNRVDGQFVRAVKTDNINTLLSKKANK